MTGNSGSMRPDSKGAAPTDEDDAPDLSQKPWLEKFATAAVRKGRPRATVHKVQTTIRLDPDVIAYFRNGGPGWQSRINAALRAAMKKSA